MPSEGVTHETYWRLDSFERARREEALRELPAHWLDQYEEDAMPAYEASQPPLYYWLVAAWIRVLPEMHLIERVWYARMLTVLLASLVIPVGYHLAHEFFRDKFVAVSLVAIVAIAPGLALTSSRVSNEGLAIALFSIFLLCVLMWPRERRLSLSIAAGAVLGAGLLTKAYFLTAVPALVLLYVWDAIKSKQYRTQLIHASTTLGIAFAIAGWWYLRNYSETGTLSALDEALMLRNTSMVDKILETFGVNWLHAIATVMLSHIWYGGWSLLALPKWIYVVGFAIFAACLFGIGKLLARSPHPSAVLLLDFYVFFWIGQLYHIAMLFISKGSSTAMGGWYLYSVIWAEATLGIAGLFQFVREQHRRYLLAGLLIALTAIDVFGIHVISIPYYAQGEVIWSLDLSRLLINKPEFIGVNTFSGLWIAYVLSTLTIIVIGLRALRAREIRTQTKSVPT